MGRYRDERDELRRLIRERETAWRRFRRKKEAVERFRQSIRRGGATVAEQVRGEIFGLENELLGGGLRDRVIGGTEEEE